jgi:hypothetical protein
MPQRIQLQRTHGWRKPAEAITVRRPTRYGTNLAIITVTPVRK